MFELSHFGQVVVEHTRFAAQCFSLSISAAFGFFEQARKDLTAATQRGKADTVGGPGERSSREGNLQRWITSVLRSDLGDLLVDGDCVSFRRTNLSAGEPHIDAVMMMAQAARMMKSADRRNDVAMFLQRFE